MLDTTTDLGGKLEVVHSVTFTLERILPHVGFYVEGVMCIGEEVAIKLESGTSKNQQLGFEYKVYRLLKGGIGIPSVYYYGVEGAYNVMVMELLGPSLEDLFNYCNRRFSIKTVCMLALELIQRIEYIHSKNFIHRDIKPDNFVVGLGKKANIIHVIDFGLSKRYRNPLTKTHIPYYSFFCFIVATVRTKV